MTAVVIRILIANEAVRGDLKGLSQGWGAEIENLRASLFNDDLSNEPTFSQIHLVGQYL